MSALREKGNRGKVFESALYTFNQYHDNTEKCPKIPHFSEN